MPRPGCEEVVLLTGFPSFHARRLLEELVSPDRGDRGSTFVHAVVQPKFATRARDALDALPAEQRARVNLVEGDAASMDLGLSGVEVRALASQVDRIHHAAQISYLGADRKAAEHVNVDAVREILEFARLCPSLKCLIAHSTAQVAGNREGTVLEAELKAGQSFRNVVEETRARGERMLRAAMDRVPIAILRPAIVVGDSTTGEIDRFDGPYLLIVLILTAPPDFALPLPGRGDAPLPLVPVDYVARAAHAIGRDPRAPGRTFHLVDPNPLAARRVFELVAQAGGRRSPRGFIPANVTRALLRTPGLERFAKSPRGLLHTLGTNVSFDARNTTELLRGTDIRCPPLESYIGRLVQYVELRLREKRAKTEAEVHDPLG
jgi:nucleoside-diphosphate-sugar epimerase